MHCIKTMIRGVISPVSSMRNRMPASGLMLIALLPSFCGLNAQNRLRFGDIAIDPGEQALLPVMIRTDTSLHAFSLAFSYPASVLTIEEFRVNTDVINPDDIGYSTFLDKPEENYAITGTVLMWKDPGSQQGFPQTGGDEGYLGWIVFSTEKSVQPDVYPVVLQNDLGTPTVKNSFSSFGTTIFPDIENGSITIRNNNTLRVVSGTAVSGEPVAVYIEVDHKQPLAGLQISFAFDNTKIHLRGDVPDAEDPCDRSVNYCGMELEEMLLPDTVEQLLLAVDNDHAPGTGWAKCAMIFDYNLPFEDQVLPPGMNQSVLTAYFETGPGLPAGTSIAVDLVDTLGSPVFPNKFLIPIYSDKNEIVEMASVFPVKENGIITIEQRPRFKRGYLNGDDTVNIADAVFLLKYLFANGDPSSCFSASDVNDDSAVNLADVITLLKYLYAERHIPEPFHTCGHDPTDDTLSCQEVSAPCQ